jgi:hypothetical protein
MARRFLVIVSSLIVATFALSGCSSSSTQADKPLIQMGGIQGPEGDSTSVDAPKLGYFVDYSYVAGDGLSLEGRPGNIYKVTPKGDPMKVAANVAKLFGVAGSVERIEEFMNVPMPMDGTTDGTTATTAPAEEMSKESFVYYQVGSKDWTGPSVQLYWNNTGSWYYNNPAAYNNQGSVGCASTGTEPAPEKSETEPVPPIADCVYEPRAPKNLPSAAEARAQAVKIFNSTGLSIDAKDIRIEADTWGVYANASFEVEGEPVGIEWSVSWGDEGLIAGAGGHSFSVTDMGKFDTISDREAVKRVSDWRWNGMIASSWYREMYGSGMSTKDGTVSSEVAPSPGSSGEATVSPDSPADDTSIGEPTTGDDGSVLPQPEKTPEKVTVVLERSVRTFVSISDKSNTTWLVPGYIFFDKDGGIYSVISVVPGVIELPEPTWMLLR